MITTLFATLLYATLISTHAGWQRRAFLSAVMASLVCHSALAQQTSLEAGLAAKNRGHFATAIRAWQALAESGVPEAQNNLGHMYEEGLGVAQNYTVAMNWYRQAADNDLPEAQHNVGLLYYNGYGVAENPREAVRWFRQAALEDVVPAQYMLGLAYQQGNGVDLDYQEARRWFLKAARQGSVNAQFMYAYMLQAGEGADSNPFGAYIWATISERSGYSDASDVSAISVILLEDDQVAEADRIIQSCLDVSLAECPE
jgi:TPR repeat protein